jgi:hypothetical protein
MSPDRSMVFQGNSFAMRQRERKAAIPRSASRCPTGRQKNHVENCR